MEHLDLDILFCTNISSIFLHVLEMSSLAVVVIHSFNPGPKLLASYLQNILLYFAKSSLTN